MSSGAESSGQLSCVIPQQSDTQSPAGSAGGDSQVSPSKMPNQPRILKVAGVAESHPGTFLLHVHAPDAWQRAFTLKILVTEETTVQAVKDVIEQEELIEVDRQRLRLVQDPSHLVAESSYLSARMALPRVPSFNSAIVFPPLPFLPMGTQDWFPRRRTEIRLEKKRAEAVACASSIQCQPRNGVWFTGLIQMRSFSTCRPPMCGASRAPSRSGSPRTLW